VKGYEQVWYDAVWRGTNKCDTMQYWLFRIRTASSSCAYASSLASNFDIRVISFLHRLFLLGFVRLPSSPSQTSQFPNMNASPRIQPPNASQPTYSSSLNQVKQYTAKIEDVLENLIDPIKRCATSLTKLIIVVQHSWPDRFRYLPEFGGFLIVVTSLVNALRVITKFGDVVNYLTHLPGTHGFVIFSVHLIIYHLLTLTRQCWRQFTW